MTLIAAVLWLWLGVSICVYAYRIYRRITGGKPTPDTGGTGTTTTDEASRGPLGPASALIQNPVAGFAEPATTSAGGSAASEPPPIPVEFAPPIPNPPDPQDRPVWSEPPPSALSASERRAPRQPIAEAVAGIQLPCDLGPLVGDVSRVDPFDVAFFTTTHDGDSVRGALAGELVRLGYQVATTSAYRLSASRADAELAVTVYPDPTAATEAARPLFPTAAADSVVVRFQS